MTSDTKFVAGSIAVLLTVTIAIGWWWFPQKWRACQKLYDSKPAQVFCLLTTS